MFVHYRLKQWLTIQESYWFYASEVFACLQTVPFNAAVGSRYIKYINTTLQFQSTLSLLKTPPDEYQQPGIDIEAGLDRIQSLISSGYYQNQYAFESDVQQLLYGANDGHLALFGGLFNVFQFGKLVVLSTSNSKMVDLYTASDP